MGIPLPKSPLLEPAFALPPVRTIPSRGPMPRKAGQPAVSMALRACSGTCLFCPIFPMESAKKIQSLPWRRDHQRLAEMGKLPQ
jgi:hypothetical protein